MNAPISARMPPATQAPRIIAGVWTSFATTYGLMKMPDPMIPPITTIVASNRPTRAASRSSGPEVVVVEFVSGTDRLGAAGCRMLRRQEPHRARLLCVGCAVRDCSTDMFGGQQRNRFRRTREELCLAMRALFLRVRFSLVTEVQRPSYAAAQRESAEHDQYVRMMRDDVPNRVAVD